jgi:hypothetical protein
MRFASGMPKNHLFLIWQNDVEAVSVIPAFKQAQTMDVFLGLIEDGVRDCKQIAQEMKISPATASRLAKRASDAGKIIIKSREYFLAEGEKFDKKS